MFPKQVALGWRRCPAIAQGWLSHPAAGRGTAVSHNKALRLLGVAPRQSRSAPASPPGSATVRRKRLTQPVCSHRPATGCRGRKWTYPPLSHSTTQGSPDALILAPGIGAPNPQRESIFGSVTLWGKLRGKTHPQHCGRSPTEPPGARPRISPTITGLPIAPGIPDFHPVGLQGQYHRGFIPNCKIPDSRR